MTPLVSIVIPTHGRPQYLPRAVTSALTCQGDSVEVIVVPNGSDDSWKTSLAPWATDPRVRVSHIDIAHGNAARNHGMSLATGKYIRFLDDDDYLLPGAAEQLSMMEETGAEICSGSLENIDEDGSKIGTLKPLQTQDFVCAATTTSGFTLPVGNLFRSNSLVGLCWDTTVHRLQDNAWMLDLAIAKEWNWVHCNKHVGVWFQHRNTRVSSMALRSPIQSQIVDRFVKLARALDEKRRFNQERQKTLSSILWVHAHSHFASNPLYCTLLIKVARHIDPTSYPAHIHYMRSLAFINPLTTEWLLLPPRIISFLVRGIPLLWKESDHVRRL